MPKEVAAVLIVGAIVLGSVVGFSVRRSYQQTEKMAEMKLCYQPVIAGGQQYAWSTCR